MSVPLVGCLQRLVPGSWWQPSRGGASCASSSPLVPFFGGVYIPINIFALKPDQASHFVCRDQAVFPESIQL